ncbi:MAG: B12-binding domain-containing radical SAM protein [Armatimonadetes bacterium]|nr:B12-binding domain-containing radical SAM protein [Armatimonadota bacterium]
MKSPGYPIVLTADRTLMAGYRLLFDGMLAASQTSTVPPALLSGLLMPWARNGSFRAQVAPLGLRRIEAALMAGGFCPDDVVVADEAHLRYVIGPATRIVAVTSGEPAGRGMNSSTMTEIAGGAIYPELMFRRLMEEIRRCAATSARSAKIILGGPGAWQIADDPISWRMLGIDHVVTGYAEGNAVEVFQTLMDGGDMPEVTVGQPVAAEAIPTIRGASTMGVVEISRGCGLGCSFCTIARVPMIHLPEATIVADVQTNVSAGITSIAALSEDFFRYGAKGLDTNPRALISLLTSLRRIEGLRLIQIDHANISSIAQYSDAELQAAYDLLVGDSGCRYPWVNVGIETASGELLGANGGAPKMWRCARSEWAEFAAEHIRRLCRIGFLPMASLIVGLPGEQEEDIRLTLEWVESLQNERITIFPVLYAPIDGGSGVRARDLSELHWKLVKACYRLNFKWIPRMYWDNQAGAGVSITKRLVLQALGRGQILQWNALLAIHGRRAR